MMLGFTLDDYTPHVPDSAAMSLERDLRTTTTRVETLAASLDPKATPQGVADAVHDALTALREARDLAETLAWGVNG